MTDKETGEQADRCTVGCRHEVSTEGRFLAYSMPSCIIFHLHDSRQHYEQRRDPRGRHNRLAGNVLRGLFLAGTLDMGEGSTV